MEASLFVSKTHPESPAVDPDEIEDDIQSSLSGLVMVVYLTIVVTLTAFCTQFAVDSIDVLSHKANVSKPFIGLILLPILNNDLTPIGHTIKDKMDQTISLLSANVCRYRFL